MKKIKNNALLKKGIWIKEKQGNLVIGSLDAADKSVVVIPDELGSKLLQFENDMIEALYGEDRLNFDIMIPSASLS